MFFFGVSLVVEGTSEWGPAGGDDVGIRHCGTEVFVSEQLLYLPDVVSFQEQMGGKGVAERVRASGPRDSCFQHGEAECPLDCGSVNMVAFECG